MKPPLGMTRGEIKKQEGDPKGGISRLAKMRKPQCTAVHEDFRIKRNAEITLLGHPLLAALQAVRYVGIIRSLRSSRR